MILITAGALACSELQAEVGRLPPSFLPLGNRRLYEHQIEALRQSFPHVQIQMSLAEDFEVPTSDLRRLEALKVPLVRVPPGLSLGESVLCAINTIGRYDESLRILHGDTLLGRYPLFEDAVALADTHDDYAWEVVDGGRCAERVWCGFFAFSDIKLLARCLSTQRGRFVEAVHQYQTLRPQQAELVTDWLDLGHVSTYFRSRAAVTTQRAFNSLKIADGVVHKSSDQTHKMEAEWRWYESLPPSLKPWAPQPVRYGDEGSGRFYEIEYLPLMPLNELFVHGRLPPTFWSRIFKLTQQLLDRLAAACTPDAALEQAIQRDIARLLVDKTQARLARLAQEIDLDLQAPTVFNGRALPSLSAMAADCAQRSLALPSRPGWMHGDLCFSNLLYDSRTASLKMIDPRGLDADERLCHWGDLRYDMAKVVHSVIGQYDHILAGRFELQRHCALNFQMALHAEPDTAAIQQWFSSSFRPLGLSVDQVMPVVVLLFLSMLPLHRDQPLRQQALLANALRLYTLIEPE